MLKFGDPASILFNEDLHLYAEQMTGMVQVLERDIATVKHKPKNKILSQVYS